MSHFLEIIGQILLDLLSWSSSRLCACILLSLAMSALVLWLVPSRGWGIAISIGMVVLGTAAGVMWENRNG